MANIERTFRGGVVNVGGSWQRITGSVETHEKDVAESLKKVEDRYKGLFKSLDKQMRAAQKQMSAQFDALTPAEQQIKNMQDAASASDLQGALSAAQAELAEATKYGDTAGIAEAQKKMREAERNIMLAELAKTAEAERAQRETEREAAQDAFNEEWEDKREALQTKLDGELTQIREQGEFKRMILDAQMAEQQAQEQAALEASQASLEAQRAGERVALQHQLEDQAAAFMRKRNMFIGNHATIVGLMNRFARKMEISGVKIGAALAKGLDDAGKVVKGKAAGLAKVIADYLETGSPTKLGPMSSLDTWWSGLAPALVDGIDTGALEGGIAAAASLEGAIARGSSH
jgi:hypothetical protein